MKDIEFGWHDFLSGTLNISTLMQCVSLLLIEKAVNCLSQYIKNKSIGYDYN